tara:strand:- start:298 stop:543 length:246 start_codon:yes stop_codon:yes gene_type:complete
MNIFDKIMQPLNKDHCLLFYYLGIISFIFAIIAFGSMVINLFKNKFKFDGSIMALFMSTLSNFVMYYFARIHYSICLAALN